MSEFENPMGDDRWSTALPRLILTADTEDFDVEIMQHFQEEGFQLAYLAYSGDQAAYQDQLQHLADYLEPGEQYAIVAYGDAATQCLEACLSPMPKLVGLIVYYPSRLPNTREAFPSSLRILIHLASSQTFGTRYPSYRYPGTHDGFAEHDLAEFDKTAASLAWSRTLGCLRRSFGIHVDLEHTLEHHIQIERQTKSATGIMETMVTDPYVNHIPTMIGAIGADAVQHFYHECFAADDPPDLKFSVLSRTVGVDRVVDELLVTFTHSHEVTWMLPGVPPTGKPVEVVLVMVANIRGRKLCHKHFHWDQATVLAQIGLLDPLLVPKTFHTIEEGREKEVSALPVRGVEAARKVVNGFENEDKNVMRG